MPAIIPHINEKGKKSFIVIKQNLDLIIIIAVRSEIAKA